MKTRIPLTLSLLTTLLLAASCSRTLMLLPNDLFTVSPQPLVEEGGNIPFTINGHFPEQWFKKSACVTLTPVLIGKQTRIENTPTAFQGEKVMGNAQEVSQRLGSSFTLRGRFPYLPTLRQSELAVRVDGKIKGKTVLTQLITVGIGVNATASLISRAAASMPCAMSEDKYQYAIEKEQEAQIKYLVQQTNICQSALGESSVQDFVNTLRRIKEENQRLQIDHVTISAYASPEGNIDLNTSLAKGREKSSQAYVNEQLKKAGLEADVQSGYTAEDWDGFQTLVKESHMQDKDIILRVLSMYKDPQEREQQIRNLSAGYRELADEVLPELRRARLTVHYLLLGRTDDEIQAQYKSDAGKLSADELLYAALLTEDANEKESIYITGATLYPKDYRAFNNLGVLAYQQGDTELAQRYFEDAYALDDTAPEVNANRALAALHEVYPEHTTNPLHDSIETFIAHAAESSVYKPLTGMLHLAKGEYAQGQKALSQSVSNAGALAAILNKDYITAIKTLTEVPKTDGLTYYLKAIVAARTQQNDLILSNLQEAFKLDPSLKALATTDMEFATLFHDIDFQNAVK